MKVRPVRPSEHAAVGALTLAAYDAVGDVSDDYRTTLADVADRIGPGSEVLVATLDGVVVGAVTVVDGDSAHFEHGRHGDGGMRMLAVAPSAQGRGVGTALLEEVVARSRAAGRRRLVITSMEWMPAAHRLYERHGFRRRPDLDVRFSSGVGRAFALDLTEDADEVFPSPGPVPDEPPRFVPRSDRPPSC